MELKEIIYGTRRERIYTESTTIGGIICPLIKMNAWEVYIYGGGAHIEAVVLYLWNLGIEVKGIFDCDPDKEGKNVLDKVPVIYPYRGMQKHDPDKTFAIVNTAYFYGTEQCEIVRLLSDLGITRFYALSEPEKVEIRAKAHPWADVGRIEYYRTHLRELEDVHNLLYDDKSREIMLEFIRTYVEFGTYSLKQCNNNLKYFFGQDTDGSMEEIYRHLEDEVWINCGSNNGDNIFWFFANGLKARAIYAYEADKKIYTRLIKNLGYLPENYRSRVHPVNAHIDDRTDWTILRDKVTLINADIEGGELDLLHSMKDIIMMHRPVLAICAYHKPEDLTQLPRCIQNMVREYCFVLRKYESNVENVRRTAELVLYAIPKERMAAGNTP